jgi:hypothetical protein
MNTVFEKICNNVVMVPFLISSQCLHGMTEKSQEPLS